MKKSIIKAIAIVTGLCCLICGCGDAKTPVKDNDGKKTSVSTSGKQDLEKDEDKRVDESSQETEQEVDGFVHDWSTGHENHYGYGTVNDWNRSERLRNYVVQDQWLYYSNAYRIYKMPVGGTAADVRVVYDTGYGLYYYDSAALNIQVVGDWIYYFLESNDEVGGLYRVRTDGEMPTHLLTNDDMTYLYVGNKPQRYYYVIDERIYYIAKEKLGATADSTNFYLACKDLSSETNEVVKLMQVNEKTSIMSGFEDSVILSEPYERVGVDGTVITVFENDYRLWQEMPELILWDYEDNKPTFINMAYDIWNNAVFEWALIKHYQDGTNEKQITNSSGNVYVDVANGEYYYEGFFPFDYPKENYADSINGLYYGNKNGENRKINNDRVCQIFSGIDDYVYYDLDMLNRPLSSYEKFIERTPVKYRIKKDGTGFEEVSWMFP